MPHYQPPTTSLLTAHDARGHVHLIVGRNPLAAARCGQSLAVGAVPVLVAPRHHTESDQEMFVAGAWLPGLHHALQRRVDSGEVRWIERQFENEDVETLGRPEIDGVVDAVFVTEGPRSELSKRISSLCRRRRIPVNVVDAPTLSTFTLLSVHADGPLQVGVTTNGRGCKLAGRVRREVAASLPRGLGEAVERLGALRRRLREEEEERAEEEQQAKGPAISEQKQATGGKLSADAVAAAAPDVDGQVDPLLVDDEGEGDDSVDQGAGFNRLVDERAQGSPDAQKGRRGRWLAQMCEYWPLRRLAAVTDADVEGMLEAYRRSGSSDAAPTGPFAADAVETAASEMMMPPVRARPNVLVLAGAGPGDPSLLTHATYAALQRADLVLADKLVPSAVLDLVPRRTEVRIARKFPGNADAAQDELMELARSVFASVEDGMAAPAGGKVVVRLKQGDPFLFGRGGEEVTEFEVGNDDGGAASSPSPRIPVRVVVLPGLSSALVAPLLARIPCTMRGIADQVLVCTGTGRKGRPPEPPEFVPTRTAVFLMALHRVAALVGELTAWSEAELAEEPQGGADDDIAKVGPNVKVVYRRRLWPVSTPCAVIERASCADQRVIRTTLAHVAAAVDAEGSRPPGLLVVGRACKALMASRTKDELKVKNTGAESVGSDAPDWTVEEGFAGWAFDDDNGLSEITMGWGRHAQL